MHLPGFSPMLIVHIVHFVYKRMFDTAIGI